jgi:predicted HTH domain antitoxin
MSEQELRAELAVHLYQRQKLSLGKAKELAGLTVWQFLQLLGSRGIPVNYDVEDFEEDVATLKRLGRQ